MRNRFPGICYRCKKYCASGQGHFERYRGGWRVQHASCAIEYKECKRNDQIKKSS